MIVDSLLLALCQLPRALVNLLPTPYAARSASAPAAALNPS